MIDGDAFMLTFRIIHVVAGVFWVGSVFMFVMFLQPTAAAIGPAAGPFMGELLAKRKLVDRLILTGSIAVVAGLVLYVRDWLVVRSFDVWIGTHFGLALTLGSLTSLVALAIGVFGTRPNVMRNLAIAREVAASGKPPTPERAQELAAVQGRLKAYARIGLSLLVLAVILMAGARHF